MKHVIKVDKQKGAVLLVSLVFLVALTAVTSALMQNSTVDMKMSGASEVKSVANQAAVSAVDEVIFNQVSPGQVNLFALSVKGNNYPIGFQAGDQNLLLPGTNTGATANITVSNNRYQLDLSCPHKKNGSDNDTFECNKLRVQVDRPYGRENNSNIQVNSIITQELIKTQ
ncbi:PilX N-terminal domain-containing pilus assembly protein [Litorilituus sediminis]|uniref:Type 4 fimbrial biogenesis protein PilX N-terminal domain-containing protein n=1 Tax=Litorilituus sediminis TaxID=718192 RepID=A0A4P6P2F0_9GAMM|nr:PilX N-terminal domain-containing pilus assembly protein [Litorilituus sediminis]QBG35343.1 hypothetical protein EMK97_06230 [Litorilituus sediminis]